MGNLDPNFPVLGFMTAFSKVYKKMTKKSVPVNPAITSLKDDREKRNSAPPRKPVPLKRSSSDSSLNLLDLLAQSGVSAPILAEESRDYSIPNRRNTNDDLLKIPNDKKEKNRNRSASWDSSGDSPSPVIPKKT